MEIPDLATLLKEFAEQHNMRAGKHIERLPIRAGSLVNIVITSGYRKSCSLWFTFPWL